MNEYTIQPLNCGLTIRDTSQTAYQLNPGVPYNLPVISYYVTDGREKIIVDTGGTPADGRSHMYYAQAEDETLEKQLGKIGVDPKDVQTVIFTHLHWDHCANNHLFPNAKFYAQREELRYAAAPIEWHRKYYDPHILFQTKYEFLDKDCEILEGINVLFTPGHSPGSQSVLVNTKDGIYAIPGDLVTIMEQWEANPKIPNGLHVDLVSFSESLDRLSRVCDHILPSHDPRTLAKEIYP
jgi:glyoxylase-like metal-dependent hydrolase (beta-lactamase superfamily II)